MFILVIGLIVVWMVVMYSVVEAYSDYKERHIDKMS